MPWICPECEEEITRLRYSVNTCGREYGDANLTDNRSIGPIDDHEYGETDGENWDGRPEYECPECNAEISLSNLIWKDEEISEEEEKPTLVKQPETLEETEHLIITPSNPIVINTRCYETSAMICKDCMHTFIYDSIFADSFCGCPKCGETTSPAEYNKLLAEGYFNKNDNTRNKQTKSRSLKPMAT